MHKTKIINALNKTKIFLKPTKITWIVFALLVVINISAPFIGLPLMGKTKFVGDLLLTIPLMQVYWIMGLFMKIGFKVTAGGGNILSSLNPNLLGLVLMGIAFLLTLALHYIIASFVSYFVYKKRNSKKKGGK